MPTGAGGDEGGNRSLASALSACTSRLASGVRAYVCVKRRLLVRAQTLRYIPDFWIFHLPLGLGVSQAILLSGFCVNVRMDPRKKIHLQHSQLQSHLQMATLCCLPSFPLPSNCCQQQKKRISVLRMMWRTDLRHLLLFNDTPTAWKANVTGWKSWIKSGDGIVSVAIKDVLHS